MAVNQMGISTGQRAYELAEQMRTGQWQDV